MKIKSLIKKLITIGFVLVLSCFSLACEGDPPPAIDYSKYEYYGTYHHGGVTDSGSFEIELKLEANGNYTMDFRINTGIQLGFVTEYGSYDMEVLDQNAKDSSGKSLYRTEKATMLYLVSFSPYKSSGYMGQVVNTYSGYITQNSLASFAWVYCDIVGVGATIVYINENVEYVTTYSPLEYTVSYLAEEGGNIEGYSQQRVTRGKDGSIVTAVADYGYAFDGWSDGVQTASRSETEVKGNIEVTATFIKVLPEYTLTYTCTDGGSLQGELSQTVFQGLDGTKVTAIPGERYYPNQFIEWSDGVKTAERIDLNVQSNLSVTAIFKPQFRYNAYVHEGNGSVETSTNTANHANEYTVTATATADEGWAFVGWTDGVGTPTRTDVLVGDLTVRAIFAREFKLIAKTGGGIAVYNPDGNEQTHTEVTLILRPNDRIPYYEAVADSGYRVVGWSKYEDGHSMELNNSAVLMIEYYHSSPTYYAFFEMYEDNSQDSNEDGSQDSDETQQPSQPIECEHVYLQTGMQCGSCNMECYVKIDSDVLMYDQSTGDLVAEFYGYSASRVFKVYSDLITEVFISNSVEVIEDSAFYEHDKLVAVNFEENSRLKKIGKQAFCYSSSIESIMLPQSVTTIDYRAFMGCPISFFEIGNNVKIVGEEAFYGTRFWNNKQDNSIVYLGNVCLGVKGTLPINSYVEIKEGTLTIADNAFEGQGGLRSVTFPQSLKNIGDCAFYNCLALFDVNSGGNVEFVNYDNNYDRSHAFENTAYYQAHSEREDFYFDKVLVRKDKVARTTVFVKDGTESISAGAFAFGGPEDIVLPKSIKEICEGALYYGSSSPNIYYLGDSLEWCYVGYSSDKVYYYSESEPPLNVQGTAYDDNYWKYGANGEIVVWEINN